ncbi:MAG TPA: dihydrolipoamide acetyltransferase family protein [Pseudonocardia sp.]|jgi:pyruvate dehydrogenase E2 component (dihydrolipoamide acetyltransferase)|uniref:dihydrolipoamide acetyltransferase family protein n=1 Tax=Pseudonocardia sp. TaxID=60912 RepID=UPI002B4AF568|nr:dihydrolipoamide acetyltransferase family protein [Pseudonocardia sp.]HLU54476.1 dihydrolipoamide acetyltransferase family protein [Pseudonocardia sp.]
MPEITMPRLSDTMESGVIATWHKHVGDPVHAGDVIADIETDKAIMELEAYEDGVLERILVGEGESAPIGAPIGVLGDGTGATADAGDEPPAGTGTGTAEAPAAPPANPAPPAPAPAPPADRRPPASPLARRLARERGVDLATVRGTGPNGRVIRADIEAAAAAQQAAQPTGTAQPAQPAQAAPAPAETPGPAAPAAPPTQDAGADDDVEVLPLPRMRQVAAERLTRSKQEAPHIYLTRAVDVTELLALRGRLNETLAAAGGPKVSVNDLVIKAVAGALRAHPEINVSYAGDSVRRHRRVHVGVAVAVESGLLVPVVRDADRMSVSEIAARTRDLATRARDRKLRADEMTGSTFTVSNLGMYGIEQFTAVINPPEAAILAVGAATEEIRPRDGEPVVRSIMRLTLSCDHRVVDGAVGAAFLQTLAAVLEAPLRIIA